MSFSLIIGNILKKEGEEKDGKRKKDLLCCGRRNIYNMKHKRDRGIIKIEAISVSFLSTPFRI